MTANELQRLSCILSNQTWCRHWLNWLDRPKDVKMAIQCRDNEGTPERVKDLESKGFELFMTTDLECQWIYVIPRTNEDGTPFESKLF